MKLIPVLIESNGMASIHVIQGASCWTDEAFMDYYASRGMTLPSGISARVVLIRAKGPHDALVKAQSIRILKSASQAMLVLDEKPSPPFAPEREKIATAQA